MGKYATKKEATPPTPTQLELAKYKQLLNTEWEKPKAKNYKGPAPRGRNYEKIKYYHDKINELKVVYHQEFKALQKKRRNKIRIGKK